MSFLLISIYLHTSNSKQRVTSSHTSQPIRHKMSTLETKQTVKSKKETNTTSITVTTTSKPFFTNNSKTNNVWEETETNYVVSSVKGKINARRRQDSPGRALPAPSPLFSSPWTPSWAWSTRRTGYLPRLAYRCKMETFKLWLFGCIDAIFHSFEWTQANCGITRWKRKDLRG